MDSFSLTPLKAPTLVLKSYGRFGLTKRVDEFNGYAHYTTQSIYIAFSKQQTS